MLVAKKYYHMGLSMFVMRKKLLPPYNQLNTTNKKKHNTTKPKLTEMSSSDSTGDFAFWMNVISGASLL